jgi:hypothetical protein
MVAVNGLDVTLGLASDRPWVAAASPEEAKQIVVKTMKVGEPPLHSRQAEAASATACAP